MAVGSHLTCWRVSRYSGRGVWGSDIPNCAGRIAIRASAREAACRLLLLTAPKGNKRYLRGAVPVRV